MSRRPDPGAARALVTALFDDAATFPPGDAPMPAAVRGHGDHRRSWYADLVGPFLCATSRVPQLQEALAGASGLDPLAIVLVADNGVQGADQATRLLLDDDRVELVGIELALPREGDPVVFARHVLDALAFSVPTAIEIPQVAGWQDALDVLAQDGAERAKFRTGGPTAAHIPTPDRLADLVVAAVERQVPFKLTAGLHHAIRGAESTDGIAHHGFLNLLAGTALALRAGTAPEVAAVLSATDASPVLAVLAESDPTAVRRSLTSIGTCSIADPVADLLALGMLEQDAA